MLSKAKQGLQNQTYVQGTAQWGLLHPLRRGGQLTARTFSQSPLPTKALMVEVPTTNGSLQGSTDVSLDQLRSPEAAQEEEVYKWTRCWYPVNVVDYMDKRRPTKHMILGRELVVWWDHKQQTWHCFADRCPHRLAPLSQGRVQDGSLVCSYHGWSFGADGKCNNIPQLEGAQQQVACGGKRTCATSYPVRVENNLLCVWLDNSPQGVAESQLHGLPQAPGMQDPVWIMNEFPNDFRSWLEQGMDPTHANFLHAGMGPFTPEDVLPMDSVGVPKVDVQQGFVFQHRAYSKRSQGLQAERRFIPPMTNIVTYRNPAHLGQSSVLPVVVFQTFAVPVRPGYSRVFFGVTTRPADADLTVIPDSVQHKLQQQQQQQQQQQLGGKPGSAGAAALAQRVPSEAAKTAKGPSLQSRLLRSAPHWVMNLHALGDQDAVIMAAQERALIHDKLTSRHYHAPAAKADGGVLAMNMWLEQVGYPASLFPHLKHDAESEPPGALPLEQILDRRRRHVDHCKICQQGLAFMTSLCWGTSITAALVTSYAVATAAVATVKTGTPIAGGLPLLVSSGVGPALGLLAASLWDMRASRFVSGVKEWKRKGGLSLVKMP